MTRGLVISPNLTLPLEVTTERLGFLGRTGQGKSYAALLLAEQMHAAGAQFVALDPVGIWWGLRLAKDGKAIGLPIPVLGGLHGDLPLEATGGALVADLVVDRGVSMVIDVSQFESNADKARFARDFAVRLFFRMKAAPRALHVFLEEAQAFIPQEPEREEARMVGAFTTMAKIGRNYGFGVSVITQRPQEVSKKVLNLVELLFCFQLNGPHERKAVEGWIQEHGVGEDIKAILPKLRPQHPHVWSPSLLEISKVVPIGARWTFDASATPKVGQRAAVRELTPIDLDKLRTDMAATIAKAAADDPKALRARIAELERQSQKTAPVLGPLQIRIERVEVPVISPEQMLDLGAMADRVLRGTQEIGEVLRTIQASVASSAEVGKSARLSAPVARAVAPPTASRPARSAAVGSTNGKAGGTPAGFKLGSGERAVLTAIAQHDAGVTRQQLSILTGYKRSSRDTYIQRLSSAGLIHVRGETIMVTPEGLAWLPDDFEPLPTGSVLRQHWLQRLPEGEAKLLRVIVSYYPSPVTREDLSLATDYKRSSRDTYLQRLSGRRLITTGRDGTIYAAPELFD